MVQEYLNLDFAPLQSWPLIEHELHFVANVVKNGKVISVKTLRRVRPGLFVYQRLRGRVEISDTRRIEGSGAAQDHVKAFVRPPRR